MLCCLPQERAYGVSFPQGGHGEVSLFCVTEVWGCSPKASWVIEMVRTNSDHGGGEKEQTWKTVGSWVRRSYSDCGVGRSPDDLLLCFGPLSRWWCYLHKIGNRTEKIPGEKISSVLDMLNFESGGFLCVCFSSNMHIIGAPSLFDKWPWSRTQERWRLEEDCAFANKKLWKRALGVSRGRGSRAHQALENSYR